MFKPNDLVEWRRMKKEGVVARDGGTSGPFANMTLVQLTNWIGFAYNVWIYNNELSRIG